MSVRIGVQGRTNSPFVSQWLYTYDTYDVGTTLSQTRAGLPEIAKTSGTDNKTDFVLSYLPGQHLSCCTCPGESHPWPIHSSDQMYVGRSGPEIDMFEAQVRFTPSKP